MFKRFFAAIVLSLATLTCATAVAEEPVPQAVRVMVQDSPNMWSAGSGTLVADNIIVTNNHVVIDRAKDGIVTVKFPDGTTRVAEVVKVNVLWDLAALRIEPVDIEPIELGVRPTIGDVVTVGGYGPGEYQTDTGEVMGFYLPSNGLAVPDIMCIDTKVRQGDSGGGMFREGKLVGVLFGQADGTYGTCVSQVKKFLDSIE
jgi:putative serine protease PepD